MALIRPFAALALLTWLLPACGESDTAAPVVPPTVRLASVTPSTGPGWDYKTDGPPPTLVMPCDGLVAVGVWMTDFAPRPPGGCGETQNCGYAKIVASPFAKPGKDTLGALKTPALFELEPTFSGVGTFTATLVDDRGVDYPDLEGKAVTDALEATFEAATGCE